MRKIFWLFVCAIIGFAANKAKAQSLNNFSVVSSCGNSINYSFGYGGWVVTDTIWLSFGNGISYYYAGTSLLTAGTQIGTYTYASPGTFIMQLGTGGIAQTAIVSTSLLCSDMYVGLYYDANNNCVYESSDARMMNPQKIEIDSAGIPIDTTWATSGFYYHPLGSTGTIYTFKTIPSGGAVSETCPSNNIISDTVSSAGYHTKNFGFGCNSSNFDLSEYTASFAGVHHFSSFSLLFNNCVSSGDTFVTTVSNQYSYQGAIPPASSVNGNILKWNFSNPNGYGFHFIITSFETRGNQLPIGDTVHSSYAYTPLSGDILPSNNTETLVDTVNGSYDPNEMSVKPTGNIPAGTRLQYNVEFENTGNAAARNIRVDDTLSDSLDIKTLQLIMASAPMDLQITKTSTGQNLLRFFFNNINLLDSSHHGECIGMFSYSIKTKTGLADGTVIPNSAGIYFDSNAVVNTNTAYNVIGIPAGVTSLTAPKNTVLLFPNPANNELTIKTSDGAYNSVSIINTFGQQIMQSSLQGNETKLDIQQLSAGIYYVILKGDSGVRVEKLEKL